MFIIARQFLLILALYAQIWLIVLKATLLHNHPIIANRPIVKIHIINIPGVGDLKPRYVSKPKLLGDICYVGTAFEAHPLFSQWDITYWHIIAHL